MRFRTWVGIIAIVTLTSEGLILSVNTLHPSCPYGERIRMPPPFPFNGGYSYVVDLPDLERLADTIENATRSPLVICEDDRLMGPAHSFHQGIRESGRGRFSHWGTDLLFSTSDNSDPNTNGRSYQAIRTDRP
jgi:hypothetical protein